MEMGLCSFRLLTIVTPATRPHKFTGNAVDGRFEGRVTYTGWKGEEIFYTHNYGIYGSEQEYAEALDPKKRMAREAREQDEQRKYAQEKRRQEDAFNALLRSPNPRQMYLSAVQLDDSGDKGKAKTVYRELLKRHPSSQEALLASQRLTRLSDVEAVEASNSRAASAISDVQNQNYQQCMNNRNACYGRCSGIKNYSARSDCQNGCAICQQ
ncbi:MAG: hypothetical protein IPH35_20130 [Rhodoferax sp.]|nr:hypothetical protein [Rhodoferax sp.]